MAMWIWLFAAFTEANAEETYYHQADIGKESALFARAIEVSGSTADEKTALARKLSGALEEYRAALDILGPRGNKAEQDRHAELKKEYVREHAVMKAFAETMGDDFNTVFLEAMERAVKKFPDTKPCASEVMISTPGREPVYQPNTRCAGRSLNKEIAAIMDKDPVLLAEVEDIFKLKWPTVDLESAPQKPTVGKKYIRVHAFIKAVAGDALKEIELRDYNDRRPFYTAINTDKTVEELGQLRDDAARVSAATATQRLGVASPFLVVAEAQLQKWAKDEGEIGWCANPTLLGGCEGEDVTMELVPRLLEVKKIKKLVGK